MAKNCDWFWVRLPADDGSCSTGVLIQRLGPVALSIIYLGELMRPSKAHVDS